MNRRVILALALALALIACEEEPPKPETRVVGAICDWAAIDGCYRAYQPEQAHVRVAWRRGSLTKAGWFAPLTTWVVLWNPSKAVCSTTRVRSRSTISAAERVASTAAGRAIGAMASSTDGASGAISWSSEVSRQPASRLIETRKWRRIKPLRWSRIPSPETMSPVDGVAALVIREARRTRRALRRAPHDAHAQPFPGF